MMEWIRKKWPLLIAIAGLLAFIIVIVLFSKSGFIDTAPAERGSLSTPGSLYSSSDPFKYDNSQLPITPVDALHITGIAQDVDIATYRLKVDGLVSTPLSLTYDQVQQYPAVTETVLLVCPDAFWDNATWTGVPVKALLSEAGVQPGASKVAFRDFSGYSHELDMDTVKQEGVFLAYKVNGEVLPKVQGFPLRLVVKGEYGFAWVKWIGRIEVK
jgi:DMSO/TMAO reductase YedYZ molybdopterin-dependent catalytic subunit